MRDLAAEHLRAEIRSRYWQLQRLPRKPDTSNYAPTPDYLALEAEIRALSDRYQALTQEPLVRIGAQV